MNLKKIVAISAISLAALASLTVSVHNESSKQPKLIKANYHELSKTKQRQIDCLAKNIYHEAVGESRDGWMAVGMVTMNRVESGRFGRDVCSTVYQKTGKVYQFSWVRIEKKLTKINVPLYNDIVELATMIYYNHDRLDDATDGATFYHADYVNPKWKGLEKTNQIGRHIFYRQDI